MFLINIWWCKLESLYVKTITLFKPCFIAIERHQILTLSLRPREWSMPRFARRNALANYLLNKSIAVYVTTLSYKSTINMLNQGIGCVRILRTSLITFVKTAILRGIMVLYIHMYFYLFIHIPASHICNVTNRLNRASKTSSQMCGKKKGNQCGRLVSEQGT